ncbi:MAG: efflux RND transporter periplasmic adaptor subunit [Fusobacteriaceae bacterium]|jgi:RND family efflux transporter MFP subunit|nr:efflux RND transporter periplasmic adaptor subunit [Fusobacteriaceae bacterium]
MKKLLLMIMLGALLFSSCIKKGEAQAADATRPAGSAGAPIPPERIKYVKTGLVTKRKMSLIFTSDAVLEPKGKIDYKTEQGGTVETIYKKNGDVVRKGEVVMELSDPATKGTFSTAETNWNIASANFEKFSTLYQKKLISYLEYAPYETAWSSAKGNYETAKSNYEKLLGKAPIDGIVGNLFVKEGNKIEKEKVLFTVVDDSKMEAYVGFPAEWLTEIEVGEAITLRISALNESFDGTILEINPIADSATKKFRVKISVDNPKGRIKDGMYAIVTVPVGSKDTLSIEDSGVFVRDLISYVYIVEDGAVHRYQVTTGTTNLPYTEISYENIKEGDRIVIDGIYGLEEGDKIEEAAK